MTLRLTKRTVAVALVVVAAGACSYYATVAFGDPSAGSSDATDKRTSARDAHLARWLALDDSQAEKVSAADPDFRAEMRRLRREVQRAQLKLANLVEADQTTESELSAGFEELGQAHLAVHRRVAKHVLAIRPLLNTEQRSRFMAMLARELRGPGGEGDRGGRQQGRPGGPGGPGGPDRPDGQGGPDRPRHRPPHEGMGPRDRGGRDGMPPPPPRGGPGERPGPGRHGRPGGRPDGPPSDRDPQDPPLRPDSDVE